MSLESVVFEIQVERPILEQLLNDNENIKDSYHTVMQLEENIKSLKDEVNKLRQLLDKREEIIYELTEENLQLKSTIRKLEVVDRCNEEKTKTDKLGLTENQLFRIQLQQLEEDKSRLIKEFERERVMFEMLLKDNTKLKDNENKIEEQKRQISHLQRELETTKKQLAKIKENNRQLDEDKFHLETNLAAINEKFLVLHQKANRNDLDFIENKLVKLKMRSLEKEKEYLLDEFERERTIILRQNKPRMARLEENIKLLRSWIEKEARERRPKVSDEVKALKAKIEMLEREKVDMIEGFEMERRVFRKVLNNNGAI